MATAVSTPKRRAKKDQKLGVPNEIALIQLRLEGCTPGLLMDNGHNIDFSNPQVRPGNSRPPREQAESCLYLGVSENPDKIVLPIDNILACMVSAGRFVKVGRRQVSTGSTSLLPGALQFIALESLLLEHANWEVHQSNPVNAAGSRSLKWLPLFPNWAVEFEVSLDCSFVPVDVFRKIVDIAGKLIGLGPKRPERKRMFGRFLVTRWEVNHKASR